MDYWVYYHWHHHPTHALIHKSKCGECQNGHGKRTDKQDGLRGEWRGFKNYQEAKANASQLRDIHFERVRDCKHCNPS